VTLSKTKKKPGLERKGKVVAEIKDAIDKYSSAYVFTYDNMRNQKLKDLREQLKSSSRYGAHMSAAMPFCLSECYGGQGLILVLLWSSILPFQAIFNCSTSYTNQQTLFYMLHSAPLEHIAPNTRAQC